MKTNAFKYIFFTIVILLIGFAIYALYKDGNKKIYATKDNEAEINMVRELNIGISGYDNINPILSNNRDIQYIDKLIFEPLVSITYDFKIENKIAEEFSKINDTTYIVKLREDKYFHNGEKLTAKDVIFTINNLMNDSVTSIYKENIKDIQELQQIDDYTIKILLKQRVDFFEYLMCIPILAKNTYQDNSFNITTDVPVGTGIFKIAKIENDKIILEKSNYENKSKITKINILLKDTVKDLYLALTKKEIDLMVTDNMEYEKYVGKIGYNVVQYAGREFDYLVLNNENSILSDKEVRKAINYAIDRNQINYNIYNNKYNICEFPLSYGSYLDNSIKTEYDINEATNSFTKAGWTLKNNVMQKQYNNLSLRLLVNKENDLRVKTAENIKEQLEKIGIAINIISVDDNQFKSYVKNKNYDIILTGNYVPNNPNLNTYFGENNLSNFDNEEIKNILGEIKNIDNQEDILKEKYTRIEEIYKENIPFISLYINSIFVLSNKNLKGDLSGNWYNIYYNIDNWYKVE